MNKGEIKLKVSATREQYEEMLKLSHKRIPGKLYSPFGKYLIDNFGEQLSDSLFEHHSKQADHYYQNIHGTDQSIEEKPD
jgi:hypothetical protein